MRFEAFSFKNQASNSDLNTNTSKKQKKNLKRGPRHIVKQRCQIATPNSDAKRRHQTAMPNGNAKLRRQKATPNSDAKWHHQMEIAMFFHLETPYQFSIKLVEKYQIYAHF